MRLSLFVWFFLMLLACPTVDATEPESSPSSVLPAGDYEPNQLIVKLGASITETDAQSLFQGFGARVLRHNQSLGYYLIEINSSQDIATVLSQLRSDTRVAEVDYNLRRSVPQEQPQTPNDPLLADQSNALQLINWYYAFARHAMVTPVVCGLVDTGLEVSHPDLLQSQAFNSGEIPDNNDDDDHNGYVDDYQGFNFGSAFESTCGASNYSCLRSGSIDDFDGHGTGVAGIIAATVNNSVGIVGVSNNGARVVPLKVFTSFSPRANVYDIAEAIIYAVNSKMRIINLSLSNSTPASMERDAVKYAAESNVLVVSAAGNSSSSTIVYPAGFSYPETLAVGAADSSGGKASYSNYGSWVDLSAPGDVVSTNINHGYALWSGTSFAAPMVAGVAALIMSNYPELSAAQVADAIRQSATVMPGLSGASKTGALLNAYQALLAASRMTPLGGEVTPHDQSSSTTTTTTQTVSSGGGGGGGCTAANPDGGLLILAVGALARLMRRCWRLNH